MSQQIAIIVEIDIEAALKANKLDGNIYLVDNLRTEGSTGEGTGNLITAVNGSYWYDKSQASEVVFNWLLSGIGSLPKTLPTRYKKNRLKARNKKMFGYLNELKNKDIINNCEDEESINKIVHMYVPFSKIDDGFGNEKESKTTSLTITGKYYDDVKTNGAVSYLDPVITDITGEAVDKGVIFPAQYGSPVDVKDGWYWSATTDTTKTGIYTYTLHIRLFKPIEYEETGTVEWKPVDMTYDCKINITNNPKVNGFTNGGLGELPIY